MTPEITLTLTIIVVAIVLFATEKLRVDVIALMVLLTLALTGLVTFEEAFLGFSSPAVITVWSVYIVSGGLFRTGIATMMGRYILKLGSNNEARLIGVIMLTCGLMSAFMNNIGATAILLPAVIGVSRQTKIPVSHLLIPLSFSSLLGGNLTLIGTPPNILAANILRDRGLESFAFFDFTPMGIIVFSAGIIYMVFVGRHLLPARLTAQDRDVAYRLREYISEVRVTPESPLVGKDLMASRLGADYDLSVLALFREGERRVRLHRDTIIEANDLLIVEGAVENLMSARNTLGLISEDEQGTELLDLDTEHVVTVEATLAPRASIVNRSLRQVRFRDKYGFTALAIWRQGGVIMRRLADVKLRFGDALLLLGPRHRLPLLQTAEDFLLLEPVEMETHRRRQAPIALGIAVLVLLLVMVGNLPISTAMLSGALLMVLTGCLTMDEAYESIEWRSVFLIAGMLPLGMAMESTGTARFLADQIINLVGGLGPLAVLAGIYVLASLVTEPMSNAAATVLIVPIAIDLALELGVNPQTFVLGTVIAASTSFLTPVGHQANVLVFGAGGYRFFDYTRVGAPLNVVIFIITLIFLPLLWPL